MALHTMQHSADWASEASVRCWSLPVREERWWLLWGQNAPGTLAESEPHRPDILTLSTTLECQNDSFLVNAVEIPTTYFPLADQSYRRAGRADGGVDGTDENLRHQSL